METNFFGLLWLTQAVLPIMRAQGHGHIVQLTSVLDLGTWPTLGSYNASKFAILSDLLEQETGKTAMELIHISLINEAKNRLRHHRQNISEAAFQLGFENLSYFSKLFKRQAGVSPNAFRKQLLNQGPSEQSFNVSRTMTGGCLPVNENQKARSLGYRLVGQPLFVSSCYFQIVIRGSPGPELADATFFIDIHQRFAPKSTLTFGQPTRIVLGNTHFNLPMDVQSMNNFQQTHTAVWNEKDRTTRDALMQTIYADDIIMYDKDFILTGNTAVSDFIDKLFAGDANFNFSATKPLQSTQNGARLYWAIRTGPQPNVLTGMDFFVLENGKVAHLFVFMDAH